MGTIGASHAASLDQICQRFSTLGAPPEGAAAEGALRELLGASILYESFDGASNASYNEDLVSWPPS
eukprot:6669262-Karenia_brevis.AAC.1